MKEPNGHQRGVRSRSFQLILPVIATLSFSLYGQPAAAATGDLIAVVPIPENAGGIAVAFDGTFLYYTVFPGTQLHRIRPDGTGHTDVPITDSATGANPGELRAMTFDVSRGKLWAAFGAGTSLFLLDTTTGQATFQFSVAGNLPDCSSKGAPFGCLPPDGLAYDGIDDSIRYSPDGGRRVYHFSTGGQLLGVLDVDIPPNDIGPDCLPFLPVGDTAFTSGVAVGGPTLLLAANGGGGGCPFIFLFSKTGIKLGSFSYAGARAEDIECDNVTFNLDVIWVRDFSDGVLRAYEIPEGTCQAGGRPLTALSRRMTGGGGVQGTRVTFGFELHCHIGVTPNQLEINEGPNRFHLDKLTSANCSVTPGISPNPPPAGLDTYMGSGLGHFNGMPGATTQWIFQDAGEPSTGDTVSIIVKDAGGSVVVAAAGTIRGGNIQAHGK